MTRLTCFKAYDIRGRIGTDLDEAIARRIGRGFARALSARRVVVGRDCRASSASLMEAVVGALIDEGVEVLDLGLCGTEEMYHATSHFAADGGIEVTASHNPMDYNGLKMVRSGSAPLDAASGLAAIQALAERNDFGPPRPGGCRRNATGARAAYVGQVMSFVDPSRLIPLKILINSGNGTAGPTFDAIEADLSRAGRPLHFVKLHHQPDGSFPNGIPNPLLAENQPVTAKAVLSAGADFGVAFDGDFDRCFFFDHLGHFIPGEYIVGLLAEAFLRPAPGQTIIHDPRIVWNTQDLVAANGGKAVQARTGHAFMKQAMRDHGAIYGGEMSAHHYFRDFFYCDSGMIPWLLVAQLVSDTGRSLADLVAARRQAFPSSGEINFRLADPAAAIRRVRAAFAGMSPVVDETDGLSLAFADWRFNLRSSNTEPVVRLNIEARGKAGLIESKLAEITALLQADSAG